MLKELDWDTLDLRRKKNRLALMYKLSHNLMDIETEKYLDNLVSKTEIPVGDVT